ncbi:MAG: hypothetical protein OXD54_00845 [Candidatus Poribacteria bacterium]|nr:hypothetical protein [Candidatus Poribacteria bacterium]
MASNATATMTWMIDALPETLQNQVLEHLQEYVVKLADESDEKLQEKCAKMLQSEIERLQSHIKMSQAEIEMFTSQIEKLQSHIEMYESQIEQLENWQDEFQWEITFKKTQDKLIAAAQRAKEEIANSSIL